MYHSIQDVPKNEVMRSLHVSPKAFRRQMKLLKVLGFTGLSITEALREKQKNPLAKVCAITFDDGYQNFITNALPILSYLNFTSTVYLVSSLIGQHNKWDEDKGISYNPLMTIDELHKCKDAGVELGCHTHTHSDLTSPYCSLESEIETSKTDLETILGVPVVSFCYPYGSFNAGVTRHVIDSGFKNAVTMERGRAALPIENYHQLPRIPVTWHTLPHLFMAKIVTSYEDAKET